ncbi:M15 family metallopeptidase [Nocardioides zeae]|uniref:M15 family metallopeptidase n=1 Tax=Nocardioides imazamoxiresistens TaxID=3231893 RepID=A0ABU3PVC0_9ACTN|nr:M15 family metallopeptidase [Nocardioides zeae]MDT9593165.1 M15 family metallopeptidase [Nocardioides zeae]
MGPLGTPRSRRRVRRGLVGVALGALLLAGLSACSDADPETSDDTAPAAADAADDTGAAGPGPAADPRLEARDAHAVEAPGALTDPLLGADLLVSTQSALDEETIDAIRQVTGVEVAEPIGLSQIPVQDQVLTVASVDPAGYRRFAPAESAQLLDVWTRVAAGEIAVQSDLGEQLRDGDGYLRLGNEDDAPQLHVGALAPQVSRVQAVVNKRWGETLGVPGDNAALVATGIASPQEVRPRIEELLGDGASVQILGPDLDVTAQQTAVLTGGSVAAAVGTFSYSVLDGGRIAPDQGWVSENIRTQQVPILGDVTCHKVMLPQLEAALREVSERGLADRIDPTEFGGCYYPRFIANTTQPSLHSFGIAVDLNVPGNGRGTVGEIDRTVVDIFKKWGFAWGGDWSWTDPMHFELARLVEAR